MLAVLLALYVLLSLLSDLAVFGAFTEVARGAANTIEQNAQGTWCFYPQPHIKIDVACTGTEEQFIPVIEAHVAQGVSISYYAASLQRLGGSEYPVETSAGVTFLCVSGQILDGRYITQCGSVRRDNIVPGFPRCTLERSQEVVTDGCYEPGLTASRPVATSNPTGVSRPFTGKTSGVTVSPGSTASPTGVEGPNTGGAPYNSSVSLGELFLP